MSDNTSQPTIPSSINADIDERVVSILGRLYQHIALNNGSRKCMLPSETPAATPSLSYKLPFIRTLSSRFIEAGTNCVAVIHTSETKRSRGSAENDVSGVGSRGSSNRPQLINAECIRFRNPSKGPLLLNHILILPHGASMSNGAIVGQTKPPPRQCCLEAWASNCLPALLAPDDTPQQLRELLLSTGEYHQLTLADGSIPDSVVLVPPITELDKEEDRQAQQSREFPSFLLTDSIIIRGIYENLTICIFGTEVPEAKEWSKASKRIWSSNVVKDLKMEEVYGYGGQREALAGVKEIAVRFLRRGLESDGGWSEADSVSFSGLAPSALSAPAPEEAFSELLSGFRGNKEDGGKLFMAAFEKLRRQSEAAWKLSLWDKQQAEVCMMVRWAFLPLTLQLMKELKSLKKLTADVGGNCSSSCSSVRAASSRVVKLLSSEAGESSSGGISLTGSEEELEAYWSAPLRLKVSILELATYFGVTAERARFMAIEGGLVLILVAALQSTETMMNFRLLKVAGYRLLSQLCIHAPGHVIGNAKDGLCVLASGGASQDVAVTKCLNVLLTQVLLHQAASRTAQLLAQLAGTDLLALLTSIRTLKEALFACIRPITSRDGKSVVVGLQDSNSYERDVVWGPFLLPQDFAHKVGNRPILTPFALTVFHSTDVVNRLCQFAASEPTLVNGLTPPGWEDVLLQVEDFRDTFLYDIPAASQFVSDRSLALAANKALQDKPTNLTPLLCLAFRKLADQTRDILWPSVAAHELRIVTVSQQGRLAMALTLASDWAWGHQFLKTIEHSASHLFLATNSATASTLNSLLEAFVHLTQSHQLSLHHHLYHFMAHHADMLTLTTQKLSALTDHPLILNKTHLHNLLAYFATFDKRNHLPSLLSQLESFLRGKDLVINADSEAGIMVVAGLAENMEEGRKACENVSLLGGYEIGSFGVVPEVYESVGCAEECEDGAKVIEDGIGIGACCSGAEESSISVETVMSCLVLGLREVGDGLVAVRESCSRSLVSQAELDEKLLLLDPQTLSRTYKMCLKGLKLAARHCAVPDSQLLQEAEMEMAIMTHPQNDLTPLVINLSQVCLHTLQTLLSPHANHLPPAPLVSASQHKQLLDPSLFSTLLALLLKISRIDSRTKYKVIEEGILEVFRLWHGRGDEKSRRFLLKKILALARGTSLREVVRLKLLNALGGDAFMMLKGGLSGLTFSVVHSSHQPPMLPLHLSSYNLSALQATLHTAFFSTVVTLSAAAKVTDLDSVVLEENEEFEEHQEQQHQQSTILEDSTAQETTTYVCCHIPSANFAATDDRHISMMPATLRQTFPSPIFPSNNAASDSSAAPPEYQMNRFDEATCDTVFDRLSSKVKDHAPCHEWRLLQTTTLEFDVLVDFLQHLVFSASDRKSPHFLALLASVVPAVVSADLPLLPLLYERFAMLASRALPKVLDSITQTGPQNANGHGHGDATGDGNATGNATGNGNLNATVKQNMISVFGRLTQLSFFLSMLPSLLGPLFAAQPDALWTGSVLRALAKALSLLDANATRILSVFSSENFFAALRCLSRLYRAVLSVIREQRQSADAFTLLSQTRPILTGILGTTQTLTTLVKKEDYGEQAWRALVEIATLVGDAIDCPFVRQLLAFDMPDHALDAASQTIFAEAPPPASVKSFVATQTSCGTIVGVLNALAPPNLRPSNIKEATKSQLNDALIRAFEALSKACLLLPTSFVTTFLLGPESAPADSANDLLALGSDPLDDNTTTSNRLARICDMLKPNMSEASWHRLHAAVDLIRQHSAQDSPSVATSVHGSLLWDGATLTPKVATDNDLASLEEIFRSETSMALPWSEIKVPILLNDSEDSWIENPIHLRRIREAPLVVPAGLDEPSLPLRIEMENYEDPEAASVGGEPTRQKRSVSAKAARYLLGGTDSLQQADDISTPSLTAAQPPHQYGAVSALPPVVNTPGIMDDWGAFASQAARQRQAAAAAATPATANSAMPTSVAVPGLSMPGGGNAMTLTRNNMPNSLNTGPMSANTMTMPGGAPGIHLPGPGLLLPGPNIPLSSLDASPPSTTGATTYGGGAGAVTYGGGGGPNYDEVSGGTNTFQQLMGFPNFREFKEAGESIGLPVMEIFRNPELLHDPDRKNQFLSLLPHHPSILGLFQSLGVEI